MPYALLSFLWISIVGMLATAASGLHYWGAERFIVNHVAAALTATILALFAHTMTMFYFIGTGKKIKDYTSDWDERVKGDLRAKIIVTKRKLFPHMTLVCLVIVALFIIGGAHSAHLVSSTTHAYFAYGALIYHVHVVALETIYLFRNIALIEEVNDLDRRRKDAAVV